MSVLTVMKSTTDESGLTGRHTTRGRRPLLDGVVIVMIVASVVVTGALGVRSGYPFLSIGPFRPPDVLYVGDLPAGTHPVSLEISHRTNGVDFSSNAADEMRSFVLWESTRGDATVTDAVGGYRDRDRLAGALTAWQHAITASGRDVLYARLGVTLVVITGDYAVGELLRVANSLHRTTPSALML